MTMRTTLNGSYRLATEGLETASERLADFQRQVTTGKRISAPSEDPSAAVQIVREHAEVATVERYSRAANSVGSRLAVMDTVLSDIVEKLGNAQTQAMNAVGTVDQARRDATAQQLKSISDALFEDFNSSFNGSQIFSGNRSTTAPYFRNPNGSVSAYQGNTSAVNVDVDRGRSVGVSLAASDIAQGSDAVDVFTTLSNMVTAAQAGDSPTLTDGIATLKRAFARATVAQNRVGSDMNVVEDEKLRLDDLRRASTTRLSKVEDTNMVEAISGMTQAETAYRAALGAASTVASTSLMDYLK
jgi:flagellar hook-associated protein 3 FlgL